MRILDAPQTPQCYPALGSIEEGMGSNEERSLFYNLN